MLATEKSGLERDVIEMARQRVKIAPTPDWVRPCSYASGFKAATAPSATFLLLNRQIHAEYRQTYVQNVIRMDTMQAVQHYSQWRVEFVPLIQSIELHSIKIRRDDSEFEHVSLENIRFLQREAGLEGFVIVGGVTLLLLIEDVRVGDILEYSYTLHNHPVMLRDHCMELLMTPENLHVGKRHFLVRFSESRPLKWKSSSMDLAPIEQRENGEVFWQWVSESCLTAEREKNTPSWHVSQPWIQISDCPDWHCVATAVHSCWTEDLTAPALVAKADEIKRQETDPLRQVDRAIRLIQEEFRYLSVNIELGGQVPTPAENVIRRRYGDCKDLTFLLVQLLRLIGIKARPILVNAHVRHSIKDLLPSSNVFNHAIVEYRVGNETRWIDPTFKCQGGDALHKQIPNYGLGLPVDPEASELIPVPAASLLNGTFELKESFLVDTAGNATCLAVLLKTTGFSAERFRLQIQNQGIEALSKERLQYYTNRFSQAKRVGALQFRDNRESNELVLAEVFEISGFLKTDRPANSCWMQFHNNALIGVFPPNIKSPRHSPLELPYPCNIVHTFEIESPGLSVTALPAFRLKNEFFEFSCKSRGVRKFMTATFSLTMLVDSVQPDRLSKFMRDLEHLIPYVAPSVRLPMGYGRMRIPDNFGALPPESAKPTPSASAGIGKPDPKFAVDNSLASLPSEKALEEAQQTVLLEPPPRRRRSRKRHSSGPQSSLTKVEIITIGAVALALAAVVGFVIFISHAAR